MDSIDILKNLSMQVAVSGNENNVADYIFNIFKDYCDNVTIDKFNNVIGCKRGKNNKYKVMVCAHYDEIGFIVKSIDDKGFIKVSNIGGIDTKILLAKEVIVHGKKDVLGIIGAKPPHLLTEEEKNKSIKLDDIYIDTGMNACDVKEIIAIGDVITLKSVPVVLQNNKISSKSIDNRSGVATLIITMKELIKYNFECDVFFVATTQEEVGLRGATIAAYNINADIAIVIDACHGDMLDVPKDETCMMGKGAAIALGPNIHPNITKKMIEIAKSENISHQIEVAPGHTGTEAWATQVSRCGIPTILLSIPVRYMHTPIETVNINDINLSAKLVSRFLNLSAVEMEECLCF